MNSFKIFNKLPDKSEFFSNKVWRVSKIKTLEEYHDLYLKADVLLLVHVLKKVIKTCLEYSCLDPCHYFSAPGLSFDAMLKMTGVKLDLISDIDLHLVIEKGMRGGISYISKRHSKINSNDSKEKIYIFYWDANNLYGWSMIQNLPNADFEWLSKKN